MWYGITHGLFTGLPLKNKAEVKENLGEIFFIVQSCDYRIIFQALGQVKELMFGKFKANKIIIDNT